MNYGRPFQNPWIMDFMDIKSIIHNPSGPTARNRNPIKASKIKILKNILVYTKEKIETYL